jgi:peptide/nickel transport system ATP-binding protein
MNSASIAAALLNGRGDDASPLLEVEHLVTYFRTTRGVVHAVDDVSFTLDRGETLGIVGESGSGKSVLARTIMGLTPPTAATVGEVRYKGLDVLALSREQARPLWGNEIAIVFQDPMTSLNPVLPIGRQITESLELHHGLTGDAARRRAVELLTQVGIAQPERRVRNYPHELSGGMRQRVCIAIAISCSPVLLFADEPTSALDVTIQRQILDLLSDLQSQNGMTMVLITHDLGVVAKRTNRIMVMYGGRVMESGPTMSLFREMRHPYTASLLASIPRLEQPSHTRLAVIPGRPVDVIDPKPGCRFAPRCTHAQPRCLVEDPPLVPSSEPKHQFACFYPVNTTAGDAAREANLAAGRTVAGLELTSNPDVSI